MVNVPIDTAHGSGFTASKKSLQAFFLKIFLRFVPARLTTISVPKKKAAKKLSPIQFGYFDKQFDSLHKEHLLILQKIDDLQNVIPPLVIPALEEQIIKAGGMALSIDRKVPDINTPPKRKK
jgi:hypothetical protein